MNKTLLSTAILALLSTTTYADSTLSTNPPVNPQPTQPLAQPASVTPAIPRAIDCKYTIPAQTTHIESSLVSSWAGKAAVQSFNFDPANMDQALSDLKACYTDQGWQGFNDALEKSGNIKAIKAQNLTVSSQVDGDLNINSVKDNQWKVSVPLQVVYQNSKEKLTQLLTIDLLIGRKMSGDLGIMQMIASPRQAAGAEKQTTAEPSISSEPPMGVATDGSQPPKTEPTPGQKPIPASQSQPAEVPH